MSPVSTVTFYKNNSNSMSNWMIGMAKIRRKIPEFRQNPEYFHSCINFKLFLYGYENKHTNKIFILLWFLFFLSSRYYSLNYQPGFPRTYKTNYWSQPIHHYMFPITWMPHAAECKSSGESWVHPHTCSKTHTFK